MRYRRLDHDNDYSLGHGTRDMVFDIEAVAQAVQTRLLLFQNEWWEDISEGLPFWQGIAGQNMNDETKAAIDMLIQDRILGTRGVNGILAYQSEFERDRHFNVRATINTLYGATQVEVVI